MDGWEAQQVVLRVARCSDRSDIAGLAENFTEGGVVEAGGHRAETRAGIFAFFGGDKAAPVENERTKHVVTNIVVERDADSITTTSYFQVVRSWGIANWGRYVDRFERKGDRWLIAHRTVVSEGSIPRPEKPS